MSRAKTQSRRLIWERFAIGECNPSDFRKLSVELENDPSAKDIVSEIERARDEVRRRIRKESLLELMSQAQEGTLAKRVKRRGVRWTILVPILVTLALFAAIAAQLLLMRPVSPPSPSSIRTQFEAILTKTSRRLITSPAQLHPGERIRATFRFAQPFGIVVVQLKSGGEISFLRDLKPSTRARILLPDQPAEVHYLFFVGEQLSSARIRRELQSALADQDPVSSAIIVDGPWLTLPLHVSFDLSPQRQVP